MPDSSTNMFWRIWIILLIEAPTWSTKGVSHWWIIFSAINIFIFIDEHSHHLHPSWPPTFPKSPMTTVKIPWPSCLIKGLISCIMSVLTLLSFAWVDDDETSFGVATGWMLDGTTNCMRGEAMQKRNHSERTLHCWTASKWLNYAYNIIDEQGDQGLFARASSIRQNGHFQILLSRLVRTSVQAASWCRSFDQVHGCRWAGCNPHPSMGHHRPKLL